MNAGEKSYVSTLWYEGSAIFAIPFSRIGSGFMGMSFNGISKFQIFLGIFFSQVIKGCVFSFFLNV